VDEIANILNKNQRQEPPEFAAIKKYIKDKYDENCKLSLRNQSIVLAVSNSGLATTLQLEKATLIKTCQLKKSLFIIVSRE
jgi:hypothetical protein